MKKNALQKKILIGSFLCFGALTGLAGAVVYFDPALMDNWIGPSLLAAPPVIGLIFYFTLGSWLKDVEGPAKPTTKGEIITKKEARQPAEEAPVPEPKSPQSEVAAGYDLDRQVPYSREIATVQILGLLQREGRLLDFLQEDIEPYEDAQIGAAVREVHRGCRTVLKEVFGLAPVLNAAEGSQVEIEDNFDPSRIKLIGNVHGRPPFTGTLRHCGWKFTEVNLPEWASKETTDVLAPAEVEIS